MSRLHPWLVCVHAHMLAHRESMSARDAVRMFGEPRGTTAAKLMHSAAGPNGGGWFTTYKRPYEGRKGLSHVTIFVARNPQGSVDNSPRVIPAAVCSVWQLAEVMQ